MSRDSVQIPARFAGALGVIRRLGSRLRVADESPSSIAVDAALIVRSKVVAWTEG